MPLWRWWSALPVWPGTTAAPAAATAQQEVLDLECAGTMRFTYDPDLLVEPQFATLHGSGGMPCTSLSNPEITNAEVTVQGFGALSCLGGEADGALRVAAELLPEVVNIPRGHPSRTVRQTLPCHVNRATLV